MLSLPLTAALLLVHAPPQEGMLLEERLLFTIPEGTTLEFPVQQVGEMSYQRPNRVRWSADGRRVAYIGIQKDGEHPVIDDQVLDVYDYTSGPVFSETGSRVVFRVGKKKTKKTEKWWVLLDGKEIHDEDWIGTVSIAPDGEAVAFWSQPGAQLQSDGSYNNNGQILVLLEDKGRKWKSVKSKKYLNTASLEPPVFTRDSRQVFSFGGKGDYSQPLDVIALTRGKKKVSVKGQLAQLPQAFGVDLQGKRWGASSSSFEVRDGKYVAGPEVAVVNGAEVETDFDSVNGPYFSPLDDRMAFRVRSGEHYAIVLENMKAESTHDFVWPPAFGANGQLAFVAAKGATVDPAYSMKRSDLGVKGGQRFVVHLADGGDPVFTEPAWLEIRDLSFSPDGEHLAFAARSEAGWQVILDGAAGPVHDEVGYPRFSADSEVLVHGSRNGSELWWRVWSAAE